MKSAKNAIGAVAILFCLSLIAGCGGKETSVAELKDSNMKKIHAIYTFYMNNNGMTGPASKEVLMEYINSPEGQFALKRMDMDPASVEDYFVSERDGEEFVIRYGLKGVKDHAIVFEATGGEEGTRLVAFNKPIECDEDEYNDYLSGKAEGESGEADMSGDQGEEE